MSAPLPQWSTSAVRWALALGAAAVLAVPLALMAWVRTPYVTAQHRPIEQPVPFDHRHHTVDDGIDCRYCHTTAERAAPAGIPSSELCMNCHNQVWNSSPLLEPVRRSYYQGRPIRWQRVTRLPDFVFFNHSIHLANGVACETCHGRVDRMARVYKAEPLTMGFCLECHRDPLPRLRPPGAITAMGWSPPGGRRAMAAELAELYEPNPGTDCTSCHR